MVLFVLLVLALPLAQLLQRARLDLASAVLSHGPWSCPVNGPAGLSSPPPAWVVCAVLWLI